MHRYLFEPIPRVGGHTPQVCSLVGSASASPNCLAARLLSRGCWPQAAAGSQHAQLCTNYSLLLHAIAGPAVCASLQWKVPCTRQTTGTADKVV